MKTWIKKLLNETEVYGINFETHRVRKILITTIKYKVDKDWKSILLKVRKIYSKN